MHLVERDKEFQVLTSQLSDCLQGKGGVILITGPVACGKTALLHAFAEHAKACRVIYVDAVATRREKDFPLGLVGQILRNPRLSLEDSSNGNPSLASRILGSMSHDNGPESPEAVPGEGLEQLWKPVRDLAKWIPVVIGIDDLQHADEASMHALLYLIRRITSVPIMVVLNLSSFPQAEFSYFEAELRSQRHCRRIPLRSLSLSGVATVVAESVDRHASRQLIQSFHNMSGGNPLLLHTLIEDTRPDSRQATAGQAFAQAVLLCLHRSDPLMLEFARTACVLGESLSAELLSDVINVDVSVVNRSFSELNAIGLFDGKRARNEAALAALRAGIPTHERTDLHLRAAHVLQRKGAAAVIVARHLVEAGETNAPWMVDVLRAAAEQEAHDGDFALAVRCLRLARQAGSDAVERAQITSALGAAEWQLDPLTLVPLLPELVQAAQQGHLTAQQVGKVITYLLWHGQSRKATDLISAMPSPVNEGFGPYRPDDIRTQIQAWLYPSLLSAAPSSPTPGSVTLSATSLAQAILSGADVNDELLLTAEQVLLSGRLDDAALTTTLTALAMLLYADVLDHAAEWSNAWIEAADKRGLSTWSALFCAAHSIIDIRRGELSAGEAYARRALTVLPPRSWGIGIGLPLASALEANTIMGRYGKAASLLDIALPEEIFETLAGLFYMHARGEYHAAVGHPFTALADFQACGSLMREWGADHPGLLPWRGGAARAFQNLGRTAEAKQLAEEQLAMAGQNARARGASLRTLALLSEPQDRAALLTDAVAILETSADRVKLAAALADLSQTLTALGNHQAAQEAGRRASYLAKQCRAKPRLRTQQPEPAMRDRLQRERSRARLSDAEQRVAALAAAGYSNREIATELFITISTVEQHLTRVYRKLNVNRRPHLAKALASA